MSEDVRVLYPARVEVRCPHCGTAVTVKVTGPSQRVNCPTPRCASDAMTLVTVDADIIFWTRFGMGRLPPEA